MKVNTGFKENKNNGLIYLTVPQIEEAGGLSHIFTTRRGGVSTDSLDSLNLGFSRPEPRENITENYRRACNAANIKHLDLVLAKQTHGTNIIKIYINDKGKGIVKESDINDADGLITNQNNIPMAIFYADCVPILLYDPIKKAVAAIHAGWRGTVAGIAYKGIKLLEKGYGSNPKDIICAIGPSIGPCCFETGQEAANAFVAADLSHTVRAMDSGKYIIDLWQANTALLIKAGVNTQNITIAEECTCCMPDKYFSHRACGIDTGRMALIACLK